MADLPLEPPTPEEIAEAWKVLRAASAEQKEQAASALRRGLEGGPHIVVQGSQAVTTEHALSGSISIGVTMSGDLTAEVPAAIVRAATKPVMDPEKAFSIVVMALATSTLVSLLIGQEDLAMRYGAALAMVQAMLEVYKRGD